MEYVSGRPLADYIKKGARLDSEDVLKLARRLSDGLDAIHKLKIVHRDIAPDNILVPDDNILQAKFIDFGLASNTAGTEKSIIGNSVAGKFSYMAPEQLGLFGGTATAATDIYALGLVLLQIAGEKVPGAGLGAGAIEIRRKDLQLEGDKLSPALKGLLEGMLRADPADRVTDLQGAIAKAMADPNVTPFASSGEGNKTEGRPVTQGRTPEAKGSVMPYILAGVVALGLIGGGVYYVGFGGPPQLPETSSGMTVAKALALLKTDDPISGAAHLIEVGGRENLEVVVGALAKLGNDTNAAPEKRIPALLMFARMYDPETYDPAKSPFPQANASAARRTYQKAADLGSETAQNALARLGE